jgi:hypothetical protein
VSDRSLRIGAVRQVVLERSPQFKDIADPNSSIASFLSGAGALPFSGTAETGAVKVKVGPAYAENRQPWRIRPGQDHKRRVAS